MPFGNINHEFPATRFAPSLFTASPCWAVPGTPKTNGYCLRARAPHCWGLVIACASEGTCAFAHCSLWIKGELFWGQLAYIALSLNCTTALRRLSRRWHWKKKAGKLRNNTTKMYVPKALTAVLQRVAEQFLKNKKWGKNNVNNAIQNGVNFRDFCISIHYSWQTVKGSLASRVLLVASWKWWKMFVTSIVFFRN